MVVYGRPAGMLAHMALPRPEFGMERGRGIPRRRWPFGGSSLAYPCRFPVNLATPRADCTVTATRHGQGSLGVSLLLTQSNCCGQLCLVEEKPMPVGKPTPNNSPPDRQGRAIGLDEETRDRVAQFMAE